MDLQTSIYEKIIDPAVADDVIPLCELAKNFEGAGEFDRAAKRFSLFGVDCSIARIQRDCQQRRKAELLLQSWNSDRMARKCEASSWCSGGC